MKWPIRSLKSLTFAWLKISLLLSAARISLSFSLLFFFFLLLLATTIVETAGSLHRQTTRTSPSAPPPAKLQWARRHRLKTPPSTAVTHVASRRPWLSDYLAIGLPWFHLNSIARELGFHFIPRSIVESRQIFFCFLCNLKF